MDNTAYRLGQSWQQMHYPQRAWHTPIARAANWWRSTGIRLDPLSAGSADARVRPHWTPTLGWRCSIANLDQLAPSLSHDASRYFLRLRFRLSRVHDVAMSRRRLG